MMPKYKTLTKSELAAMLGISTKTLSRWLNVRYYEKLVAVGYNKNHRILTPKVLKTLDEIVDIFSD